MVAIEKYASVEPCLGQHRRQVRGAGNVVAGGEHIAGAERREGLRVPLFDHAEAAKLALYAVEVAMVESVAGDEIVLADAVKGFHLLADVDRKRQAGDPGTSGELVIQIKLGGCRVMDLRFRA